MGVQNATQPLRMKPPLVMLEGRMGYVCVEGEKGGRKGYLSETLLRDH